LKIYYNIENFNVPKSIVTIGTFDGVHLGHRKVIDKINTIARERGGESTIFTFYPHPRIVVANDSGNLRLLSTLEEKQCLLEATGVDNLVIYPFTPQFASLTYNQFIRNILVGKMNMDTLVVGYDHHLGKNREGNFENISKLSVELGFHVQLIDAFIQDDIDISSSKIRVALQEGDVLLANKYLGYPYPLTGRVIEGNQIGRNIGFPTANILSNDAHKLIPAEGVYAVKVTVNGVVYNGMLNIGFRPTINRNADKRTIEAHIFDFNADIYQSEISLVFIDRLREERKFSSIDELKLQLEKDKQDALKILES
jgi:riboflavin kinase / FMN adenylyltransferase